MARFHAILFLLLSLTSTLHARKLLDMAKASSTGENSVLNAPFAEEEHHPMDGGDKVVSMERIPYLDRSSLLSALPKGTVPPSAPSNKNHAAIVDEKLFAMHLSRMDRILKSVPSPGAGH